MGVGPAFAVRSVDSLPECFPSCPANVYRLLSALARQRQGCIHGEELAYVLGVPMSIGLGHSHLPRNFTKAEAMLSEITMNYWINFARTG